MLNIKTFVVNFIQENCYVVSDETKEAIIIDCGAQKTEEIQKITDYITTNELKVVHILITHAHFDHIWGLGSLYETLHLGTELHKNDQSLYENSEAMASAFLHRTIKVVSPPIRNFLEEGDHIHFGNHKFEIIETPGHTPGGIEFYCKEENVLFSGDSLFRGSIGRCDLEQGDYNALVTSLRKKILTLPIETKVYPGHGISTTIGYEKEHNTYL